MNLSPCSRRDLRRAGLLTGTALVFLLASFGTPRLGAQDEPPVVRIGSSLDRSPGDSSWLSVGGFSPAQIGRLEGGDWTQKEWQAAFPVSVDQGSLVVEIGQPPMAGRYSLEEGAIVFRPRFPMTPGNRYRASFRPAELPEDAGAGLRPAHRIFELPKPETTSRTSVLTVYPSAGELPENLLKFYVHFSAPMSGDRVYRHIQLIDEKDGPVELPFLELDDALWDPGMTQLTLFIDPGRIKRDVKPLEDIGPSLVEGQSYRLVIADRWEDASGNHLSGDYVKSFTVGAPDRSSPALKNWLLELPEKETKEPLSVSFGEPLDHALAQQMIEVQSAEGETVRGNGTLAPGEAGWSFVPEEPWTSGDYVLAVRSRIEDLAGNNIGKLFEVDLRRETGFRRLPKFAERKFEIR